MNNHTSSPRENFLMLLLNRVTKEYKSLLDLSRRNKPFKIIDIIELSHLPGETLFAIQLANKNCALQIKAAEIMSRGYDLNHFSHFHAEMIREAVRGNLIAFLKLSEKNPLYKIAEKRFDKTLQRIIFTIETKEQTRFVRTADEVSRDKNLLYNLNIQDIYDIGFTQGCESLLKEKTALLLAKSSSQKT